ncbi:hypothetical protein C7B76_30505 [filamentous cyanobacterium CCP2]|nr:hypothetical protein C7B76_30505 [filamentous cyanobacterium CCP2]
MEEESTVGIRSKVIHGYLNVDEDVVWDTVKNDLAPFVLEPKNFYANQCAKAKPMSALTLKLNSIVQLTDDEQFYQLCQDNPDLKLERSPTGTLIIMSPTGGETGKQNAEINLELGL